MRRRCCCSPYGHGHGGTCPVTFIVVDCATVGTGGVSGLTVITKCGSRTIDSGTTDGSGHVTLNTGGCTPGPATVNIPTVGPRYDPVSVPVTAGCNNIQGIFIQPSAGYTCAPCASHTNPPVSETTLNLTDPDYGGVVLTGVGGAKYVGTKTASANLQCHPLFLGCTDGRSVTLTYTYNDPARAGCALLIEWELEDVCVDASPRGVLNTPGGVSISNPPYLATFGPVPDCTSDFEYMLWTPGGFFTITE